MSAHSGSENCDVKMQLLAKLETQQRLYCIAKCVGGNWVVLGGGGVVRCRTTALVVVKLVVTL